jgi:hypothetical protein
MISSPYRVFIATTLSGLCPVGLIAYSAAIMSRPERIRRKSRTSNRDFSVFASRAAATARTPRSHDLRPWINSQPAVLSPSRCHCVLQKNRYRGSMRSPCVRGVHPCAIGT